MDTTIDETLKKGVKAHEETTQAYPNSLNYDYKLVFEGFCFFI